MPAELRALQHDGSADVSVAHPPSSLDQRRGGRDREHVLAGHEVSQCYRTPTSSSYSGRSRSRISSSRSASSASATRSQRVQLGRARPRSSRAIADCVVPHSTASSCWDIPRLVAAVRRPSGRPRQNRRSWPRPIASARLRSPRACAPGCCAGAAAAWPGTRWSCPSVYRTGAIRRTSASNQRMNACLPSGRRAVVVKIGSSTLVDERGRARPRVVRPRGRGRGGAGGTAARRW